jgi:HK97 gp10 family phage protein
MFESNIRQVQNELRNMQIRALTQIGLYVEGEAKLRCPVDTGTLSGSIDNKVIESDLSVIVGTNVEYALNVEKGTRRQRAKPYLTPAVEENINNIRTIVERNGING